MITKRDSLQAPGSCVSCLRDFFLHTDLLQLGVRSVFTDAWFWFWTAYVKDQRHNRLKVRARRFQLMEKYYSAWKEKVETRAEEKMEETGKEVNSATSGHSGKMSAHAPQICRIDYERSTSIAKFTPVTTIFFLLNKICDGGSSKETFLKAATLSILIWAYPRETKTNNRNFKNAAILPSKVAYRWRACALILPLCPTSGDLYGHAQIW